MKPLSSVIYCKRNKRKIFASINAVMLAVSFLFIIYSFTQSLVETQKRNLLPVYEKAALVTNFEQKPIEKDIVDRIRKHQSTERLVPTLFNYSVRYTVPGVSDRAVALPVREVDREYFMKKLGIKLTLGNLPEEGKKEIALNKDIAKNKKISIGDKVGDGINKFDNLPGEYKVVGLVDNNAFVSIVSVNDEIYPDYKNEEAILGKSFLVFAKDGKKTDMDAFIEALPEDKVNTVTEELAVSNARKGLGPIRVIDIISILSIVVMVITVGSSKYAQYINRKEEFGVLNAIGYNKNQIISKAFLEVILVNTIGFMLGIIVGTVLSQVLKRELWESQGALGYMFTLKGFIIGSFIPLFTILFSIVPINNLINKLDPIKMIEKN